MRPEQPDSRIRFIAKVLRDVGATERFEDFASLKDVLRCRLRELGARYQQAEFDAAISLVHSNAALIRSTVIRRRRRPLEPQWSTPVFSRQEAAAFLRDRGVVVRGLR